MLHTLLPRPIAIPCALAVLLVVIGSPEEVFAQRPVPKLRDTRVQALATLDESSGSIRFIYSVTNGAASDAAITSWKLEITRDPGSRELPSEELVLNSRGRTQTFVERAGDLRLTETVVPVGCAVPSGWSCGLRRPSALDWGGRRGVASVPIGGSVSGFTLVSSGLPTIRDATLEADWTYVALRDEATDADRRLADQEYAQTIQMVRTLAPYAPPEPLSLPAFSRNLQALRSEAQSLGWARPGPSLTNLDSLLAQIQSALDENRLGTARSLAVSFIGQVERLGCSTFDCPGDATLTSEARALLGINMAFLRDQLPTNSAPIAVAGADRELECASGSQTEVLLDGSRSSDPEGDPLSFLWTGGFGSASGSSPTVRLPLGRSEISLVVSDGQLNSDPDTVTISVHANVTGFEPPAGRLVREEQEAPLPDQAFNQGRTLPIRLQLQCHGTPLDSTGVVAPQIVSVTRGGEAVNLQVLNLDSGLTNDNGTSFRTTAPGKWEFNLSTKNLSKGTYTVLIQMPDGLRHHSQFVLR
jgi:hypothetical protein